MNKFLQFIKTKEFRKHLLIAAGSIFILLFVIFKSLGIYTRHGESVSVPDLHGLPYSEAIALLEEQGFRYTIDSIYNVEKNPGTIFEQEPEANAKVKENRMIYLTMVSMTPPSVKLPDLQDVSLREATAIIESYGLKAGALIYKPDLAQNAVLGVLYKGRSITKGYTLPKGSTIDLLLGDGYGNSTITVPNLIGLTFDEALFVLQGSKLSMGQIVFDAGSDSTSAQVYRQFPEFKTDSTTNINQGETIDLYLTDDKSKIIKN